MTSVKLDNRLLSVASYIRQGAYMADIGTDHAYLPVYLCQSGKISRAIASDIAKGPCERATATVERAGLSDRISVVMTNGLQGLGEQGLTDIAICGMGGELIASIIDEADFTKTPAIRLVLLPMTKVGYLREYLASHGFAVEGETLSSVQNKVYTCLCVSYTGKPYTLTPFEREFGCFAPAQTPPSPYLLTQMEKKLRDLAHRIKGNLAKGEDAKEAQALAEEIERYLCEHR